MDGHNFWPNVNPSGMTDDDDWVQKFFPDGKESTPIAGKKNYYTLRVWWNVVISARRFPSLLSSSTICINTGAPKEIEMKEFLFYEIKEKNTQKLSERPKSKVQLNCH